MSPPVKLTAFIAALAVLFGAAALAGAAIDPDRDDAPTPAAHGGENAMDAAHGVAARAVRGLAAADDGLRLVVETSELRRGATERVAFRIVGADGETVRDFDRSHERRLHLIVVRRDMRGFQHLHPVQAENGTWSTPLTLGEPGSYRLFADFVVDGEAHTLAGDLRVDGDADLRPLPEPMPLATTDGGDHVTIASAADGDASGGDDHAAATATAHAGEEQTLDFDATRDGSPVELQPYLGADGHLVALREGDLAFLHVHPTGEGLSFETTFPTPGRYRLFLQYKVGGRVETAAFTKEVTG